MFENVLSDLLRDGYSVSFVVTGDSMHPTIRSGEHLHVRAVDRKSLRVGDIILVRAQRGLTAHRIITIDANRVVTRGDNAELPDPPLPLDDILGLVEAVEREAGPLPAPTGLGA